MLPSLSLLDSLSPWLSMGYIILAITYSGLRLLVAINSILSIVRQLSTLLTKGIGIGFFWLMVNYFHPAGYVEHSTTYRGSRELDNVYKYIT